MSCVEWRERIALWAGGDEAGGEVERHLADCGACREYAAEMRESVEALRGLYSEAPQAAHFAAVRAGVMGEIERSRQVWRRLAWISGVAAMLIAAAALWPSRSVPVAPRMVAAIPPAPVVPTRKTPALPYVRGPVKAPQKREPVRVQMQTSDPNIVIYWIAD